MIVSLWWFVIMSTQSKGLSYTSLSTSRYSKSSLQTGQPVPFNVPLELDRQGLVRVNLRLHADLTPFIRFSLAMIDSGTWALYSLQICTKLGLVTALSESNNLCTFQRHIASWLGLSKTVPLVNDIEPTLLFWLQWSTPSLSSDSRSHHFKQ